MGLPMSLTKEYSFRFTAHSLQRGLERVFGIVEETYTVEQYERIKGFIIHAMEWNELNCKWVLHDYKLELVIRNHKVVSIIPYNDMGGIRPVTEYQKKYSKKRKKQGNRRNAKTKEMGDWL